MAIEKPAQWTGASGTEYTFHVFGLEPDVPARLGSYIYARRNADGAWVPLYMGHGDLSERCSDPKISRCIASKGVTHIHLRLNGREADREEELKDLLKQYANAFAPEGCHPKAVATPQAAKRAPGGKKAPTKKVAAKASATATPAKKRAVKGKLTRPRSK